MRWQQTFGDTGFGAWALRVFLGCVFLMTGILNVSGQMQTHLVVERMGLPQAAGIVVGVLEIVAGVLMFVPGAALIAAGILMVLMIVAIPIRIVNDSTPMALVAVFWLAMAAIVAKAAVDRHPRTVDEPIAPELTPPRRRV